MDSKSITVNVPYRVIISTSGMSFYEWMAMLSDSSERYNDVIRHSAEQLGLQPTTDASLDSMPFFIIKDDHKYLLAKLKYGF